MRDEELLNLFPLFPSLSSLHPPSSLDDESQCYSINMEASSSSYETLPAPSSSSTSDSHAHHLPSNESLPQDKLGQDEVMTDDMKLAISALGLLRSEGGGATTSPHHSQTSQFSNNSPALSSSQYRSTSTASTSTHSDQWGTNTNSSPPGCEE